MSADPSIAVIRLEGELEVGRREELRHALVVSNAGGAILVDLSAVTYADSTALAELLRFRRDAELSGVRIALIVVNRQFARLVQYAGLGEAFAIFGDRGSALTHLSGAGTP